MNAYPISWPEGWPRTKRGHQQHGRFSQKRPSANGNWKVSEQLTVTQGVQRVLAELERMGIDRQDVIVSTNVRTRLDGLPRSGEREPDDSGAAVYWQEALGARRVLAIDQYTRVADNLAAIAATLDALRPVERHGGAKILERAFTGFTALPQPGQTAPRTWRQVMGFTPAKQSMVMSSGPGTAPWPARTTPTKGGTDASMAELNTAYDQARKEVS